MENTLENKARFFAQYLGQKTNEVIKESYYSPPLGTIHVVDKNTIDSIEREGEYKHRYALNLSTISQISDDDAIEVAKILNKEEKRYAKVNYIVESIFSFGKTLKQVRIVADYSNTVKSAHPKEETVCFVDIDNLFVIGREKPHYEDISKVIDYLRSKGYAMPFMGLSVEDQVKYGWVKLKIK